MRPGHPEASAIGIRRWFVACVALLVFIGGCSTKYRLEETQYGGFEGEVNQHSRLIRAPADRLFDIVTDEDRFQAILPEGTVLVHATPPPYQTGTVVRMHINHIFKLTWQSQVVQLIPDKKIRLVFLDGFFAGGAEIWEFDAQKAGTRITHTIIVDPQGFWRKIAWNLKARLKHDKIVEQMLDRLERAATAH